MSRVPLLAFAGLAALLLLSGGAIAQDGDPQPNAPTWIDTEHEIRFSAVPGGADDGSGGPAIVTVDGTVRLHQFEYQRDSYSADRFREAYDNNVIGDPAVRQVEDTVENRTLDGVEKLLPIAGEARVVESASLTQDSLEAGSDGNGYQPPLVVNVKVEGDLDLAAVVGSDVPRDQLGLAFDLGARMDLPLSTSVEGGDNLTARVHSPGGLTWANASGAQVSGDGGTATLDVANWRNPSSRTHAAELTVTDPDEKAYSREDVSLNVTVDLKGVDIQLTSLPSGSLGTGQGEVVIEGAISVLELPDSAPDSLTRAGVTHVSAADIRLLVEEDLVDRSTLEDRVDNLTEGYAESTPERVHVLFVGGLVNGTLQPGDAGDETERPVRLEVTAKVNVDLATSSSGGQAVTFHSLDRSFTFSPLQSRPTSYEIILPKGVELQSVEVPSADPTIGTTEEGRDFFALDVDEGEEHTATVNAAFTESTLWHQAPELLVLLVLMLLLPLALAAWLLLRGGGDEEPTRIEEPADKPP
jgi:hypothetical protein